LNTNSSIQYKNHNEIKVILNLLVEMGKKFKR